MNAIRQHPELINKPNALGQTAVHLSVYWPECLQDLLEAGADVDVMDQEGDTPIFYAAFLLLPEPLRVLAGKQCVMHTTSYSLLERLLLHLHQHQHHQWLRTKALTKDHRVVLNIIIRLVVERRRKLEELARIFLDAKSLQSLRLSTKAVLDREASRAISMLREKSIIPIGLENLTVEHGTVYHMQRMTTDTAQDLWDAGFRGTDELDQWGLSPLMVLDRWNGYDDDEVFDLWELATWLVAKGANPHRRQERVFQQRYEDGLSYKAGYLSDKTSSTTALHYLADTLGWGLKMRVTFLAEIQHNTGFLSRLEGRVSEPGRRLILRVLSERLPDSCKCACSTIGCRAFTMAVKPSVPKAEKSLFYSIKYAREEILHISQAIAEYLNIDQPSLAWLRREMIRFNTFEHLDLPHTCCEFKTSPDRFLRSVICERYDDEEVHQIQEERAEQLERLKTLVDEFVDKCENSGSTFNEFMDGYWTDRMNEVLSEEDPVNDEALKDLGVVLRKEDDAPPAGWTEFLTFFSGLKSGQTHLSTIHDHSLNNDLHCGTTFPGSDNDKPKGSETL